MKGLILRPAGVPLLLIFEDANPQLWQGVLRAWEALEPEPLEDTAGAVADFERVILLSQRQATEVAGDYPDAGELVVVDSKDPDMAAERLTVEVTLRMLKARAGASYLLHAAVLGDRGSGRALALVAPSGMGKTTAACFLGRHLTYLTDETAVVAADLSVSPYPKPLSLLEEPCKPKVQRSPRQLGLQVADPQGAPLTLERVLLLNRVPEQVNPELEAVPLVDALLELVEQSSGLKAGSRGLEAMAELLARTGGALRLTYSEASDVLPLVQQVLRGEPAGVREDYTYLGAVPRDGGSAAGCYQRAQGSDGLASGERFLVATAHQLSEVSLYAWDVWSTLGAPLNQEELHEALEDLYGPIPADDFRQSLEGLQVAGLIDYSPLEEWQYEQV